MASGIQTRINNLKKLSLDQKQELKEECSSHHETIRQFMINNPDIPFVVRIALEDRLGELNTASDKCK